MALRKPTAKPVVKGKAKKPTPPKAATKAKATKRTYTRKPKLPPVIEQAVAAVEGTKRGRPTSYKTEYAAIARALCKRGATDADLADEFEVAISTIWRWSVKYDDFRSALHESKEGFDDRVERSLAQRAIGYTFKSERVFQFQGEVIRADIVEHVPADIGAMKLWLGCRKPEWRETSNLNLTESESFVNVWRAISNGTVPPRHERHAAQ